MSLLSRLAVQAARAYGMLVAGSANNVSADYLVVAGGGSGGASQGGGGGAGGLLASTATLSTLNTYTVTVGAGGAATASNGNPGVNSSIAGTGLTTITSIGGGFGAINSSAGGNGGSGGGGGGANLTQYIGGNGTAGQGNNGGAGKSDNATYRIGGGGGGAGAVGTSATAAGVTAPGGVGLSSSISGSSVTYAGGGGGGGIVSPGGTGGGGNGGLGGTVATAGTANTGGGGGGGDNAANGGAGGSGIVIISYTSATPKFVGGTITTSGGKQIHTFTSSGTLSPITPITASYLVVAGGGGGGAERNGGGSGGGGAGGYQTSSTTLYSGATYVVTVGGGGAGAAAANPANSGTQGSNSVLSGTGITTITSTGGGFGGAQSTSTVGGNGGSGGGGWSGGASPPYAGGTGTSGQGNNGGSGNTTGNTGGGGGGGASAVGGSWSGTNGSNNGGAGTASSITGTSVTYAGGGGGGVGAGTASTGGTGGGGAGGVGAGGHGTSGTPNLGGGGGGAGGNNATPGAGGSGGSGIVIISYAGSQAFNGGLVTTSGGNTIHTFTSTGALTPLTNNLNNSLRFRSSASAYLNRTPTVAGDRQKWTWSSWIKRGSLSSYQTLFSAYGGSANVNEQIRLYNSDALNIQYYSTSSFVYELITTQVFRDPSAWYHVVVAVDTTQATAANRIKVYVNGNQVTAFSTATYPAQNTNTLINGTYAHYISVDANNGLNSYFDGYQTDINFIGSQQLEPYYFGNNDANGVWKPIQYKGTYGTNGFYLTFGNTTSTTTLGYDSSPNGNNWTCNNISLTAGTTYDAMTDVPTNTSATVANYCTWNPLYKITGTVSNGNLTLSGSDLEIWGTMAFPTSGSYYYELTVGTTGGGGNGPQIGITSFDGNYTVKYFRNGYKGVNGTNTAYGGAWAVNDVIGIAYNASTNTVTFYKNNVSQGDITATSGQIYAPYAFDNASGIGSANFGQRPFAYTPPTGYVALNTYNLPTPTILQGNKYMDATTYTGNGGTQVIVNQAQFKPDLVWNKNRGTTSTSHGLFDSVRGTTAYLISNSTNAEANLSGVTSFNFNGFTLGAEWNQSANTFVSWQWQAGQGSTSSNTSGSITSTVSVNTTAGFSVVTYTGTGTTATIGHGLGVAPAMIITKNRTTAGTSWLVYHSALGATKGIYLDLTNAAATSVGFWNNTAPTSSVFTVYGGNDSNTNANAVVAYCWAEISGYSKFGSYTGNGSTDGPFIFTGFRPKFVMTKRTDSSTNGFWNIYDSSRNGYNDDNDVLYPNSSSAEDSVQQIDLLSNGFKLRNATYPNTSGGTYIYAAFAENPAKISNAR